MKKIRFKKNTWKTILVSMLCIVVVGGIVGGIVAFANPDKLDSKSISVLSYGVGGLDSTGKYKNTDTSIYTEKAFECQGLAITLDFEADVKYRVFFYDQDNELVHVTAKLNRTFAKTEVPFFAKFARIEITPTDDVKVSKLEVLKYAKQLNATVYREQGFKNYTNNLFEIGAEGKELSSTGTIVDSEIETSCVSKKINVVDYKEALVFRTTASMDVSIFSVAFYDNTGAFIKKVAIGNAYTLLFETSTGVKYYSLVFSNITTEDVAGVIIGCGNIALPEFYCR